MISDSIIAKTTNDYIYGTINWTSALDSANNQSTVTATMILRKYYHYPDCVLPTSGTGTWSLYINGVRKTITEYKEFNFGVNVTVISNTVVVPHNADGSKKCNIRVTGGIPPINSYTETFAGKDVDLELNVIKAEILTAPDFNDLDNPTITFSNPKNYPLQFKIEDAIQHTDLITTSKLSNYSSNSYTFNLTEQQRNTLRTAAKNSAAFPLRFTVASYIPYGSANPTYWSWLDRTMKIVGGEPTFTNFHHEDINPVSLALTGDSSVYIQNLSQCKRWVSVADKMIANKQAVPKGYTASFGDTSNYASYSSNLDVIFPTLKINYMNPNLTVKAIDSRNKTTTVTKPINLIPYDKINNSFHASVYRENGFTENVIVECSGIYSPILVGGVEKNDVSLNIKYKLDGHENWDYNQYFHATLNTEEKTYEFITHFTLSNINQYIFEINAWDFDGSIGDLFKLTIPKGEAIFYLGADKKLGINRIPDGSKQGLYIKKEDQLWDQIYPIGSVICMDSASVIGDIKAGGTWSYMGDMVTSDYYTIKFFGRDA